MHRVEGRGGKLRANFGRAASPRRLLVLMIVAGALTAVLAGAYRERPAHAAAAQATPTPTPVVKKADYSKVDDFLGGERMLLSNQDFLIGYSATITDTTDVSSSLLSATADDSVPTIRELGQGESPTKYNTEFVAGRFFRTDRDTALQFIVKGDDTHYTLRGFESGPGSALAEKLPEQRLDFLPVVWTRCAGENGTCRLSLSALPRARRVRYGANGSYYYGSFTKDVQCSNVVFGDPAFSAAKACDVYEDDLTIVSAVGDFNGDGFDDIAVSNRRPGTLRIITAADVTNPQAGFKIGPELVLNLDPARPDLGLYQITVGDFNGDKQPEVAGLYLTGSLMIHLGVYAVDPETLQPSRAGVVDLVQSTNGSPLLQIAAGRFAANAAHDQLLAAWLINQNGSDTPKVDVIDFDTNSLQPKVVSTWDSRDFGGGDQFTPFTMKLKTARFDWAGYADQAVWMVATPGTGTELAILKVDPKDLTISKASNVTLQPFAYHGMELAIGNFDKKKASIADPTKTERDPADQFAVMGRDMAYRGGSDGNCDGRNGDCFQSFLHTYTVDPQTFAITKSGGVTLSQYYMDKRLGTGPGNQPRVVNRFWLLPTDLRGRSLRLAQVSRIEVQRSTPSVVLAAPPMHADYVPPGLNKSPTVLNLSVAPDGFKSEYEQTDGSEATQSHTDTTSTSLAVEEKISASVTLGKFDVLTGELTNGVKVTDTVKATQDIKDRTEAANGTFSSTEFKISQETGLSDVLWYRDMTYYLYVYAVLGQKVCPADKPNCAEGDKVQMHIVFSAPKEESVHRLATDTLEWYQPPWEYGNVLSYPATEGQLKLYLPDIDLLTKGGTDFATDDAGATIETTWRNEKTTGQNVAHEGIFGGENDLSVEGKTEVKFFGVGGDFEGGTEVNVAGSKGTETLDESENQFSSAKGITVEKRSIFADPFTYKYFFSPHIFGKQEPVGFTNPVISNSDLTTFGALRSAFTADPLRSGAGGWWKQTYSQHPDVALNHPNRWSYSSRFASGDVPGNCVGVTASTMNCVQPAERDPENPWLDPFHDMRGLFITKNENAGRGPQQQLATAGDVMSLQARVYNYSFKAMPAGAKVKVRFYGMEWDTASNLPAKPDGESFLIGETALDPVAPFRTDLGAPLNWVLAGTTFDTTAYENQDLVFWVAVWAEDADGKLLQELAGHGLTRVPEAAANPTFEDVAGLEEMVKDPLSTAADAGMVSFSNNVGFYRAPFHVLAKNTAAAARRAAAAGPAGIKLGKIQVEAGSRRLGQNVEVSTVVRGGAQNLYGVSVNFYEGDPAAAGRLFDVERLAVLRAGERHKVNIHYRPRDCGERQIFVTVGKGKDHEVTDSSRAFKVRCAPEPRCETNCFRSPQYYLNNLWGGLPRGEVWVAGTPTPVNTRNVYAMSEALKGGNSAAKKFNREYVAAQLSLLGAAVVGERRRLMLGSTLACYGLNGADVTLSNGAVIGAATSLRELMGQAEWAARAGRRADWEKLAGVFDSLNSDDAAGGCGISGGGGVSRGDATLTGLTGPTALPASKYTDRPGGQ